MTNNDTTEYNGRSIEVVLRPEQTTGSWTRAAYFAPFVDGKEWGNSAETAAKVLASVKNTIDRIDGDAAIYERLVAIVGQAPQEIVEAAADANAETPVGIEVAFYSRGAYRYGLVTKVGKRNVEVAYVTEGGLAEAAKGRSRKATVTRKSLAFDKVGVLG